MNRFTGNVAIITGAGSGIGQATARRFGAEEATVACVDIDEPAAQKTAAAIVEAGGNASAFACNVADPASVSAAVAAVASGLGAPNVLCNIAGIGNFAHTIELPFDDWQRVIAVNLTGTFLMCQAVLPHILENGGNIVNTASNAGLQGLAYSAAYCASKGGVVQLTRALAIEYWKSDIRVNAVAPGGVDTPALASVHHARGCRHVVHVEDDDAARDGRTRGSRVALRVHRVRRSALHDRRDRQHGRRPHHVAPHCGDTGRDGEPREHP